MRRKRYPAKAEAVRNQPRGMTRARVRVRWEVRRFCWNVLAASCGLPCTAHVLSSRTYRWRWMARLDAFMHTTSIAGIAYWGEVRRAPPVLRVVAHREAA
jgi:hypothetical protein